MIVRQLHYITVEPELEITYTGIIFSIIQAILSSAEDHPNISF
jgi:hypothetical protein